MKRRKRMGMYKAPAGVSRGRIEETAMPRAPNVIEENAAPHAHDVIEAAQPQAHDPMRSASESTPEKFVAFVNRMAAAEGRSR
jgi:hypothetical protein